jgi:hypothetical protein
MALPFTASIQNVIDYSGQFGRLKPEVQGKREAALQFGGEVLDTQQQVGDHRVESGLFGLEFGNLDNFDTRKTDYLIHRHLLE